MSKGPIYAMRECVEYAKNHTIYTEGWEESIAELERQGDIERRRDEAMQEKWEFHFVWYPDARPIVEVWRKGGPYGSFYGDTPSDALESALNHLGIL